jgi:hypothetical protein
MDQHRSGRFYQGKPTVGFRRRLLHQVLVTLDTDKTSRDTGFRSPPRAPEIGAGGLVRE